MSTYYAFITALKNKNEEECLAYLSTKPSLLVAEKRQALKLCLQHSSDLVFEKITQHAPLCEVWNMDLAFALLDEGSKGKDRLFKYALKSLPHPHARCPSGARFQEVFVSDVFNRLHEFTPTPSFVFQFLLDPIVAQHADRVSLPMLIFFSSLWKDPNQAHPELQKTWKSLLDTMRPDEMVRLALVLDFSLRTILKDVREQILEESIEAHSSKSRAWWAEVLRLNDEAIQPARSPLWHGWMEKKALELAVQAVQASHGFPSESVKTPKRKI